MAQKWNLQDIRPAQPKRRKPPVLTSTKQPPAAEPTVAERDDIPSIVIEDGRKKNNFNTIAAVVIFVVVIGVALLLSAMLGKTELTLHPEFRQPNVNAEFTAYPEPRETELSYEILTLESTAESQVKASGQTEVRTIVEDGLIEIIKTTPGTQRLVVNTRFRTKDGLIFKIKESVTVPGAVVDNEGTSIPGTIRAEVFADDVGEQYNVPKGTRFDIPGLESDPALFKAIYAESREDFTGGFDGPQFAVDPAELQTARQSLQVTLRDNLLQRIDVEKPAGFVAFPGAVAVTYNELPPVEYGSDLITIREQAVLQIPLFSAAELASFLARETIPTYDGSSIRIEDPSILKFTYASPTTSSSVIANEPSLTFNLSGKPLLIWEYDAAKLTEDLANLPKTAINNAISAYPGIQGARVRITPFWQRTFPKNPEDIIIIEELKQIDN